MEKYTLQFLLAFFVYTCFFRDSTGNLKKKILKTGIFKILEIIKFRPKRTPIRSSYKRCVKLGISQ